MKPLLRLLPLAAGLTLMAGCGPDPAAVLERARTEIAAQDDRAARIDLIEVLKARPDDREVLALLAAVQVRLGDGEGAAATLARLGPDAANDARLRPLLAEAQLLRGKPDEALKLLEQDNSAAGWRVRAAVALARDDGAAALAAFRAGSEAGTDLALLDAYARFLLAGEDQAGAEAIAARMRQVAPDSFVVLMLEGDLLAARQQTEPARARYAAAATRAPRRVEPLLGLAGVADAAGQTAEVEKRVNEAAALAPDDPRVGRWVIQVAQLKGDWAAVRSALAPREGALDPRSAEGLAYAEALLNLGQPEQARALFQRALSASPQNPFARLMLAEAQLATGDGRAALATVQPLADSPAAGERELELAERAARAAGLPEAGNYAQRRVSGAAADNRRLAAQGASAYARGDWPTAVAAYAALKGAGEDPEVLRRLALAAARAGQADLAIGSADRALTLRPTSADMLYAAGLTRTLTGRERDRGIAYLAAAAKADPSNALFRASLARARAAGGEP